MKPDKEKQVDQTDSANSHDQLRIWSSKDALLVFRVVFLVGDYEFEVKGFYCLLLGAPCVFWIYQL